MNLGNIEIVNSKKEEIEATLNSAPDLRCIPFIAIETLRITSNPKTTTDEIQKLIETDSVLTARVLRLINSAHFALTEKISSIDAAIRYLGLIEIRQLVTLASSETTSSNNAALELFKYNLLAANFAKQLSKNIKDNKVKEMAFIGGLLQGIGKSFLLEEFPEEYIKLIFRNGQIRNDEDLLAKEEFSIYGLSNKQISKKLIIGWQLAEELAISVSNTARKLDHSSTILDLVLSFSSQAAHYYKDESLSNDFLLKVDKEALGKLGYRAVELRQIFNDARSDYLEMLAFFDESNKEEEKE